MELLHRIAFCCLLASIAGTAVGNEPDRTTEVQGPADAIVSAIPNTDLRALLLEVLHRNPDIAALEAAKTAAGHRSTSARKLPDPKAELTAFLLPPETRVGPQLFAARLTQQLPGSGKRAKSQRAEIFESRAIEARIEVLRLDLVTRVRRLAVELAYLDEAGRVLTDDVATLSHFEELARGRYAAGSGLQMDAIQLQAEMTRLEARRTEIDERLAGVVAEINRLRDRPGASVTPIAVEPAPPANLDWKALTERALAARPELAVDDARIDRAGVMTELAADDRRPDFSVGLSYAYVDPRKDVDVPDNGRDVLGVSGGITIPLWTAATDAKIEAATQDRLAREASRRSTIATIERELHDLRGRIPEIVRRLNLLHNVLPIQTEESFASAEAAYAAGRVDALALLDTERVLLDVRLAGARARADLAIALIDLEDAIAAPLPQGEPS